MGGSSSKEVVQTVYVESDESKRIRMLGKLDRQLDDLKHEVISVKPLINQNVRETIASEEDALLMRYSQLQDTKEIEKNIREIFVNFPALDFLVDTATKMISAVNKSEELTELLRWHERKVIKRSGRRVYGLELHYKVKILEEDKGRIRTHKETVVLIAYKCLAHVMDLNPDEYPDDEEMQAALRF